MNKCIDDSAICQKWPEREQIIHTGHCSKYIGRLIKLFKSEPKGIEGRVTIKVDPVIMSTWKQNGPIDFLKLYKDNMFLPKLNPKTRDLA